MFIRDFNGTLINLNEIKRINIEICGIWNSVVALMIDGKRKEILYKSLDLLEAQEYLDKISRKLAINYEVWEI